MRVRIAILAALVVVLAGVGIRQWRGSDAPAPAPAEAARVPAAADLDTLFPWREVHSYAEARAMLRDGYRLSPDARFLLALSDVPKLAGASTHEPGRALWSGTQWIVCCDADTVGTLPEYPTYDDGRALLASWAARWAHAAPGGTAALVRHDPARFDPDPLGALAGLDARWQRGERDAALYSEAAEAFAWLVFANDGDPTRRSDRLAGRALATLALSGEQAPGARRTHVLLARLMGYEREASELGAALAPDDPRRAWAAGDTASLARLAAARGATFEPHLLRLHALAGLGRFAAWRQELKRDVPNADAGRRLALATGLGLYRFESTIDVATANLFEAVLETQRGTRPDSAEVQRVVAGPDVARRFEQRLVRGLPRGDGPLLDAGALAAHVRAQAYASLTKYGEHLRRTLGSERDSRDFAEWLGAPGDGPAGEFARWYHDLVHANWSNDEHEAVPLARDVMELGTLGPEQLQRTYSLAVSADRSMVPVLTRALLRRMDTRPHDLGWLAWSSVSHELLLEDRDALLAASARNGGTSGGVAAMWLAASSDDEAELVRLMGAPDVPDDAKEWMLELIEDAPGSLERFERCAAAACAAHPDDESLVLVWAKGLEHRGRATQARRRLEAWLDRRHEDRSALGTGQVLAGVGRLFTDAGMPRRALTVLRADSSGKFAVLSQAARALDVLGRSEEALALGMHLVERYAAGPDARGEVALLHWAHGRDSAAAEVLLPTTQDANFWRWRLGPKFVSRFRDRTGDALRAVEVMKRRFGTRRQVLLNLASAYEEEADPATGFAIARSLLGGGFSRSLDAAAAYRLARRAIGPARALAWFDELPMGTPAFRQLACEMGVARGMNELAWLDTLPRDPSQRDWSLLVRASALDALPPGDSRRVELLRELQSREGTYYLAIARFVAQGGDVAVPLRHADDLRKRAEVFYWIGRRAEMEGREADAVACYQLCQETAQTYQSEWLWSRERRVPFLSPLRRLQEAAASSRVAARPI